MKPIGLKEAQRLIEENVHPLESIQVPLQDALDRVMTIDMVADVDSPSVEASLKEGFAVRSDDLAGADSEGPIALKLVGISTAGGPVPSGLRSGQTLSVTTGAPLPPNADAVVPVEQVREVDGVIRFHHSVASGQDILPKGSDIAKNQTVAAEGDVITPGKIGLLAAAGHSHLTVIRQPRVAIVSTGDEVIAPGAPLQEGKLYASNLMTLDAWCRGLRFETKCLIVADNTTDTTRAIENIIDWADAVITSGGAWGSDRDRVAQSLERLGWQPVFHRVRMSPGKGAGFGLLDKKPVFMLPGGPSANLTAFLQLALPGLRKMAGHGRTGLPEMTVELGSDITGRYPDWTQFVFGRLEQGEHVVRFEPLKGASRLQTMAAADALVAIPEGETQVPEGAMVQAQILD